MKFKGCLAASLESILVLESELEDIFFRLVEILAYSIVELGEAGTARDHVAHDQVRLEVEEVVGFTLRSSVCQNTGCLLERSG